MGKDETGWWVGWGRMKLGGELDGEGWNWMVGWMGKDETGWWVGWGRMKLDGGLDGEG